MFKIPYSPSPLNPAVFVKKSICYEPTSKYNHNVYPAFNCAKLFASQAKKISAKFCPPAGKGPASKAYHLTKFRTEVELDTIHVTEAGIQQPNLT